MADFDPIALIENAYRLGISDEAWMDSILRSARPAWGGDWGAVMFEAQLDEQSRPQFGAMAIDSDREELFGEILLEMNRQVDAEQVEHAYAKQVIYATLSERLAPIQPDFRQDPVYKRLAHPHGVYDFIALQIADPSGTLLYLGAPLDEVSQTTEAQRDEWARLAAHIAAGYRLRQRLGREPVDPESGEAILSSDGRIEHISDEQLAGEPEALDHLELAAEAIGRARGGMRQAASSEAVKLWRALVDARYSLLEHIDTDGKKMWVACRNEASRAGLGPLDTSERQVVQFAAMGHPERLIAYELGLPIERVARCLESGMQKLDIGSRAELIRLWQTVQAAGDAGPRD